MGFEIAKLFSCQNFNEQSYTMEERNPNAYAEPQTQMKDGF